MNRKTEKSHTFILKNRERFEELYHSYNHREFVHPDPLEFLYDYPDIRDRELVGLIASSLAYGRVAQILKSVASVLERLNPSPRSFITRTSKEDIFKVFEDFKHRFTTGNEMATMLLGAKKVIEDHGSLYECFMEGFDDRADTVLPALTALVKQMGNINPDIHNTLLSSPARGSACKRLNLFLRWMIRKDRVDPGGWNGIPLSKLIVPLDTHMHKICLKFEITSRKQADMRTAVAITQAFRKLAPHDPVRYDFALTRLGIRKDADLEQFLQRCLIRDPSAS